MGRFKPETFTTGPVAPSGGVLDYEHTVMSNTLDIVKIKITPSIAAGSNVVTIYRRATRALPDLQYTTEPWTAAKFVEPVDGSGNELNAGWIIPYFDLDESLNLHFRFTNNHTVAKTYTVDIEYEYKASGNQGVVGAPEELRAAASANGLKILSGVIAARNNSTITEAEFRATYVPAGDPLVPQDMRTVAEGGTWVPNGTTRLSITGITAGPGGAQYSWTSAAQGRWYFVWRLKNSVGWSRWSDGNVLPQYVTQWVLTQNTSDIGPPADWEVWIEEGPDPGTIVVHATRPKTNGQNLLWWVIQIKDASSGSWLALDDGTFPSEVKYDGSGIDHDLVNDGLVISKPSGGWGTAARGDLILLDVRSGIFNVNFCQWGTVDQIVGSTLVFQGGGWRPQVTTNLRLKIVKPPWIWIGGGYLGDQENHGYWGQGEQDNNGLGAGWIHNSPLQEFVSQPISIPTAITNPSARVWFENVYCRSDDSRFSTGMSGGTGVFVPPQVFKNFNDRNYWLPIYPPATWGTLAFATDGRATMATLATQAGHKGQSGIRPRFRIYPDVTGEAQIYAKWTGVTIPVGATAADRLALAVMLFAGPWWDQHTTGVGLIISGTNGTLIAMNAPYVDYRSKAFTYENMPYPGSLNFTRPPNGSIVEMRMTIQRSSDPFSTGRRYLCVNSIEVAIGGTGAYTVKGVTWPREGWSLGQSGLEMFLGWIGNCRLSGATAILEQVSILKGIGEFY